MDYLAEKSAPSPLAEVMRQQQVLDISRLLWRINNGLEKSVLNAIDVYLESLRSYDGQNMSYSHIEIPKLDIANAVLMCLDYPTAPPPPRIVTKNKDPRTYKKVPIPEELRWEVFVRDEFKCVHCGSQKFLRADHIIPESKGGLATLENLQTLCRNCNSRKGAK